MTWPSCVESSFGQCWEVEALSTDSNTGNAEHRAQYVFDMVSRMGDGIGWTGAGRSGDIGPGAVMCVREGEHRCLWAERIDSSKRAVRGGASWLIAGILAQKDGFRLYFAELGQRGLKVSHQHGGVSACSQTVGQLEPELQFRIDDHDARSA